jgi:hypothetical protein
MPERGDGLPDKPIRHDGAQISGSGNYGRCFLVIFDKISTRFFVIKPCRKFYK